MARADDMIIVGDARGVRRVRLAAYLDAGLAERAEHDANAWVKSLRGIRIEGLPFRERFTHRGDSLWWFAELYLHKMQVANHLFRTLLALEALVERERPAQIGAAGADPYVRVLARRVADRDGLAWTGGGRGLAPPWLEHLRIAARAHLYMAEAAWARPARPAGAPVRPAAVAAFVHAAFWRGHEEQYVGRRAARTRGGAAGGRRRPGRARAGNQLQGARVAPPRVRTPPARPRRRGSWSRPSRRARSWSRHAACGAGAGRSSPRSPRARNCGARRSSGAATHGRSSSRRSWASPISSFPGPRR